MMRKIKLLCSVVLSAIIPGVYAATQAERIAELEYIALYEPSDWIDENEVVPTPEDAKKKFNLTDADFYADIMFLANKYSNTETNKERRICRSSAIGWLGFRSLNVNQSNGRFYWQGFDVCGSNVC